MQKYIIGGIFMENEENNNNNEMVTTDANEIVVNELKELEKSYICTAHNIADRYYFDKWKSLTKNEDPIEALEAFIAAEQQILDRLKEIKKLQEK